jgi:hypothetical protein
MKNNHLLDNNDNYINSSLKKYLTSYAEQKVDDCIEDIIASLHPRTFNHCLTIPVYNESHTFIELLIAKFNNDIWSSTLIILVINQPDTDPDTTQNQALWSALTTLNFEPPTLAASKNYFLTLNHMQSCSTIVALDYFTEKRKLYIKKQEKLLYPSFK